MCHYCGSTQTYTQLLFLRCRNIRLIWLTIIQCACTYIRRTLFGLPAVPIISKGHGGGSGSARMDWVFLTSVSNVILPGQEAKLVKSGCAKPMKLNRRHYERKLTVITLICQWKSNMLLNMKGPNMKPSVLTRYEQRWFFNTPKKNFVRKCKFFLLKFEGHWSFTIDFKTYTIRSNVLAIVELLGEAVQMETEKWFFMTILLVTISV